MRIKDLATRATKLLTGNAYMVFDNGTKVEKVNYAELAKQIITEYNTQTLAGSAQSVKSALDALNSKINNPSITTIEALNTYLTNLPSAGRGIVMVNGTVANALIERNASAIATVAKMDNTTADMSLYSLGGNYLGIIRYNFSTSTVTKRIEAAQNSYTTIDVSNNHTLIPSGSDFNNYTTPGVYYVMSDSDGATMVNAPRKSSGKLIVMARHTSGYLAQYYYPSTSNFTRYVRSYGGGSWSAWITEEISYENAGRRQYSLGSISSSSTATFEELGLTQYQYGAYFVVLRIDSSLDGTWAGIVRHNSAGYQINEFYKGEAAGTPYVTTDGIIKTNSSGSITCYGLVFPLNVWGILLS